MQLNPYLTFDGNAAEALEFYAKTLGGEVASLMRYGEMPEQGMINDQNRNLVAHGNVTFAGGQIHASDNGGWMDFQGHHGVTLQIAESDPDRAAALFDALADGGEVTMAFQKTFWARGFGTCKDRFGVPWMVNCE